MNTKSKSTLRIYGCGGLGVNAINNVDIPSDSAGFPDTVYSLIDTSKSNIQPKSNKGDIFLIPGVDGSGKDRAFTHSVAVPHINSIFLKHPPADFNIVIFGLSGGSGSVLGPLIVEELINRGKPVVILSVISTASSRETTNAYNTIGTLQNLSTKKLGRPIAGLFYENNNETNRQEVDRNIDIDLRSLAMLASGTNEELDSQDIFKWLNYDKNSKVAPQIVDIIIHLNGKDGELPIELAAISVASLLTSKEDNIVDLGQTYSCVGYYPEAALTATRHETPSTYFIITNQLMGNRITNLQAAIDKYKKAEAAIQNTQIQTFGDGDDFIF